MKPFRATIATLYALLSVFAAGAWAAPMVADNYQIEELVPGSPFCGVHGLGVDRQDQLYAGSVVGQRIYRVNTRNGSVITEVEPPRGMADDMVFLPDGTLVWTSISQNAVRARKPSGEVYDLATDLASVNSIAYRQADNRLFVAQVFGGDGLWELDPAGEKARRNILTDIGGLNGFDIGPDGMIYGPLWFKQQVVRINPDSGDLHVVADGFHTPAAANFDSQWNLYVLDTGTGEVFRVDIETGRKEVFVQLQPSLDNLAIDSRDRIYVSNMADNAIHRIDADTGEISEVVKGGLSCANALSLASDSQGDTVYVADIFALRAVNTTTGAISDLARAHAADTGIGYPTAVSASPTRVYAISAEGLHVYERDNHRLVKTWNGMRGLQKVVELASGDLLALSGGGTQLTRLAGDNYEQRQSIAKTAVPVGDVVSASDASLYATLPSSNSVVRINPATGKQSLVTDQLDRPRGIALAPDDDLIVMESRGRIVKLPTQDDGNVEVIATDIPVGRINQEMGILSPGVAVGGDGTIYALSDKDNAVYRISRLRQTP